MDCPYSVHGCCIYDCNIVYPHDELEEHLQHVANCTDGKVRSKLLSRATVLNQELKYVYESLPNSFRSFTSAVQNGSTVEVSKTTDESTFTGELKDGERDGHGVERNKDFIYIGLWLRGLKHGQGYWRHVDGTTYEGEWKAGKRDGLGTFTNPGLDRYDGEFVNNVRHGFGAYMTFDGSQRSYDGWYENNEMHGHGSLETELTNYKGNFKCGKRDGKGLYHMRGSAAVAYEGDFKDDKEHGHGVKKEADGSVYTGSFVNGAAEGFGVMEYSGGGRYEGQWMGGIPQEGQGVEVFCDGPPTQDGIWKDGHMLTKKRPRDEEE